MQTEREALKHSNCCCSVGSFKKQISVKPEGNVAQSKKRTIFWFEHLPWGAEMKFVRIMDWVIFYSQQMWQSSHMATWLLKLDWTFNNANANYHLKIIGNYFRSSHEIYTSQKTFLKDIQRQCIFIVNRCHSLQCLDHPGGSLESNSPRLQSHLHLFWVI